MTLTKWAIVLWLAVEVIVFFSLHRLLPLKGALMGRRRRVRWTLWIIRNYYSLHH